jgi:DNA-binding transcriptional ArsR family regulator
MINMCTRMHVSITPLKTKKRAANEILAVLDSDFFKALAEPVRIELLKVLLLAGPADISSIANYLPQDRSVLSRHLQVLLRTGLVSCEKRGRHRFYTLNGSRFIDQLEKILNTVKGSVAVCCPPQR